MRGRAWEIRAGQSWSPYAQTTSQVPIHCFGALKTGMFSSLLLTKSHRAPGLCGKAEFTFRSTSRTPPCVGCHLVCLQCSCYLVIPPDPAVRPVAEQGAESMGVRVQQSPGSGSARFGCVTCTNKGSAALCPRLQKGQSQHRIVPKMSRDDACSTLSTTEHAANVRSC